MDALRSYENQLPKLTHTLFLNLSVSHGFLCKCAHAWVAKECAGVENVRTH